MAIPARANVLGVGIHALNLGATLDLMESAIVGGKKGYICVTNVHAVIEARKDAGYRRVLNNSFLTVPDGRPTVWIGQSQGFKAMDQVCGPELMLRFCEMSCRKGYSHFFYGGQPGVSEQLKDSLTRKFPALKVVGTYCPPFRPLNGEEESEIRGLFARLKPDVTWIGLGAPKQERFMADYWNSLDTTLMVGVGAAFDVHTGRISDPPKWLKRAGLAWLHRLAQQPRLWKRYWKTNPRFLCEITLQLLKLRTYDLEDPSANQPPVTKDTART
jgi:N-acetylglucosaminyldiphosphoundecaprenol N-acetyl-beta-D-mannosaminyltransferase